MKLFAPDYYNEFSCIAGKCKHSCCIGWEIDIDNETFEYYKTVNGSLGKRLMNNIIAEDTAHFVLTDSERCPFLNKNKLCDIILTLGEDKLCQICSDHPRYRSFYENRTEIGLGLCCEEAARIILTHKDKVTIVQISDDNYNDYFNDEEKTFFELRDNITNIIQDRTMTIDERIKALGIDIANRSFSEWADIYLSLEQLDSNWSKRLTKLKKISSIPNSMFNTDEWNIAFEQLLVYFIYRHMADGLYDGLFAERIAFSILGFYIIRALCAANTKTGVVSINEFLETSRLYSCEIEYCEENIQKLLSKVLKEDRRTY